MMTTFFLATPDKGRISAQAGILPFERSPDPKLNRMRSCWRLAQLIFPVLMYIVLYTLV